MVDPKDWALLSPNFFKMLLGSFLGNGGIRFFQWWSANPLPPESDTAPPFPVPVQQISLNPLNQVQSVTKVDPTNENKTTPTP